MDEEARLAFAFAAVVDVDGDVVDMEIVMGGTMGGILSVPKHSAH